MKIKKDYFLNDDVLFLAKDLIGKYLFTKIDGQIAGGIITETEAYKGINDKASHAYGGKRTKRNVTMYAEGGILYVYLCYGIHHLANIVTNKADIPDAILLRGIFPTHGEELMLKRSGKTHIDKNTGNGPGCVSKLLGITTSNDSLSVCSDLVWLEDRQIEIPDSQIEISSRIGVDYAGEDAHLPYRFKLKNPTYLLIQKQLLK
ncbi:MAG: DNA-3-methyladenine glycosylase [Bacteroidales bacterium]|nr:DNA-3-methyladenine glycosylase [Bacteroidales bacterium]